MISENNKWGKISKYLSKDMTDLEIKEFHDWIDDDINNENFFEKSKSVWNNTENYKIVEKDEIESAWNNLLDKFKDADILPEVEKTPIKKLNIFRISKIAAIILLLVGLSFITYRSVYRVTSNNEIILVNNNNKLLKKTLPDGSVVLLKKETKLVYNSDFNGTKREVTLTGEAFFDIAHNVKKPFIISANNSEIKVLGTSFNVNTRIPNKDVEVEVSTGLVELISKNSHKVILKPGNIGSVIKNTLLVQSKTKSIWKTNKIIFDSTPLFEVAEIIKSNYNVNISFDNDNISNYSLNATLVEQPIDSLIATICTAFNLRYRKSNNNYTLFKN